MIRKKLVYIMALVLALNLITSTSMFSSTTASASEENLTTNEKEIRSEIADGLNVKDKNVDVDLKTSGDTISVTFNSESQSDVEVSGKVLVNEATKTITYSVDDGEKVQNYNVEYDTNKPNFVTFIDQQTKEKYIVNVKESQLSWIPIAIAIGGVIVRGVISVASKNLTKNAIKIAGKTYKGQPKKKATNALKKAKYKGDTFRVGKTKNTVKLSQGKLEHILVGHHPKYWKGKEKKNFFDPNMSIKTIRNYIKQTINANSKHISKRLKGKDAKDIVIYKKINKVTYKLVIQIEPKKKLNVTTFFPVDKKGKTK